LSDLPLDGIDSLANLIAIYQFLVNLGEFLQLFRQAGSCRTYIELAGDHVGNQAGALLAEKRNLLLGMVDCCAQRKGIALNLLDDHQLLTYRWGYNSPRADQEKHWKMCHLHGKRQRGKR